MTRMISRRTALSGLAGLGAIAATTGRSAAQVPFYEGKTLSIVCGFNPGGGVDLGTRLIAEHIGPHIPGNPRVIVQNMEGAGGLIAANYIVAKAAPDGLTLAVPGRGWVLRPLLGIANARFDPFKLSYIGSTGATNSVAYIHADSGIRTVDDLRQAKRKILFGGLPGTSMNTAIPRLLGLLGWPVELIGGYQNTPRIILSMEQRELDGIYTPEASFARRRDLIESGRIRPVFQSMPSLPGIPLADSLVEPKDRPLMALAHDQASVGMPLVAPPGTPPERIEILRAAFMAMTKTKGFLDHARRIDEPHAAPIPGDVLDARIRALAANITPESIAAYSKL